MTVPNTDPPELLLEKVLLPLEFKVKLPFAGSPGNTVEGPTGVPSVE